MAAGRVVYNMKTDYIAWGYNTGEIITANTPKDLWHALNHFIRHDRWFSGEYHNNIWYIQLTKKLIRLCIS